MEVGEHIVDLKEYGSPCVIREAAWATLQVEDAVHILESHGILSHRVDSGIHLLEPANYVGEFLLPGRRIRILPRFPRLYADLRMWLSRNAGNVVRLMAGARESSEPQEIDPALAFVRALGVAIDAGVPVTYKSRRISTSSPRGRLVLSNTLLTYHTRGLHHLAVCEVPSKTVEPAIASVICAAGDIAMRSASLGRGEMAALDLYLGVFSADDSLNADTAAGLAESLQDQYDDNRELVDLLTAAIALFKQEALLDPFHQPALGGVAHFHKMDRLWELALVAALAEIGLPLGMHAAFHPFAGKGQLLFSSSGPEIDPDVVVFAEGGVCAVIDAKYSVANRATSGDVYQITCYVERLKARSGLLVYLTEGDSWTRRIGNTQMGGAIYEAGIPTASVVASLKESLGTYCHDVCGSKEPELPGSLAATAL